MNTSTITAPFENGTLQLKHGGATHLVSEASVGLGGRVVPLCMPGTSRQAIEEPTGPDVTCAKCVAARDGVILGGYHGWTSR